MYHVRSGCKTLQRSVCFQLLKYRGTENRAAGLPAGVGWGPWQGAMGVRARGVRACILDIYIATSYLYIHTGVHAGHLTLLPPCPLNRQARAASLSTPAATEWTALGSRPPPLVCVYGIVSERQQLGNKSKRPTLIIPIIISDTINYFLE